MQNAEPSAKSDSDLKWKNTGACEKRERESVIGVTVTKRFRKIYVKLLCVCLMLPSSMSEFDAGSSRCGCGCERE